MSISTFHSTRQRKHIRSLKLDRAVWVLKRRGYQLTSYHCKDIFQALESAGYAWDYQTRKWVGVHHA